MTKTSHSVAVIGMGVMGSALALNLHDRGYTVHVQNRTFSKAENLEQYGIIAHRTFESLFQQHNREKSTKISDIASETASAAESCDSFYTCIFVMVPESVVDHILSNIYPFLTDSDIVIDGGNSNFKDTIRRSTEYRNFVGCGISGGEVGARNGPSMMVGCEEEIYGKIREVLESISATSTTMNDSDQKTFRCCGWLGSNGAGHFVKTVHNGIEYCEMQLLQEVVTIVRSMDGDVDIADIFCKWNTGRNSSYLVETCSKIFRKAYEGSLLVVDKINDRAMQKGTGKFCINTAVELNVCTSLMAESVLGRFLSAEKQKRELFAEKLQMHGCVADGGIGGISMSDLESAFYLSKIVSFVQGSNLLLMAKSEYKWDYSIGDICRIWSSGCIIRSKVLSEISRMSNEACSSRGDCSTDCGNVGKSQNCSFLELSDLFYKVYSENLSSLRNVVEYSIKNNLYVPVFSGSLIYLNGLRMNKKNGNVVQAMRDFFGKHGVEIDGKEGVNIEWE